jgi:hypothetical protein
MSKTFLGKGRMDFNFESTCTDLFREERDEISLEL